MLTVAVMGLGFMGLTTALGFADKGYTVYGYDIDETRRETISGRKLPFLEPGLDEALTRCIGKTFFVAESTQDASKHSDIIFFCVGTPCGENGRADLHYLFAAFDGVEPVLSDGRYRVLTVKSTVPPGTTERDMIPYMESKGIGESFSIANNPEFLREGKCWEDFTEPDRIVCGVVDERAGKMLRRIYEPFGAPVHIVSLNTAEYIKYLSNTLLATLISYSNEMSLIADVIGGIDTGRAFKILHGDKRWRGANITSYIYPGCGYGGYCLPKDTQAMAAQARANGLEPQILQNVIALNEKMPSVIVQKIKRAAKPEKPVGILGLSFKPDSDDVRDSPAAKIIRLLLEAGYTEIYAYDPVANELFASAYGFNVTYHESKEALCEICDVIAIVTVWREFAGIDKVFPEKAWIDCRYYLSGI